MIHIFKIMHSFANKAWYCWLKLLCPRKYIKKINTENQQYYGKNKTEYECTY